MKSVPVFLIVLSAVMVIGAVTPAMADSGDSYKRWAISIGEASGTIEIDKDANTADFQERAISLDDILGDYPNVEKTRLGKAVNDDGAYFLVWKLISFDEDGKTIHVLDAGTGEPLIEPLVKEAGSCGKSRAGTSA